MDSRGKGYGTEVAQLILDYSFNIMGLHNICLKVYEFNINAIKAYEKAGFVKCGCRREAYIIGGRKWDIILMEALSTEFESPVIKKELLTDFITEK